MGELVQFRPRRNRERGKNLRRTVRSKVLVFPERAPEPLCICDTLDPNREKPKYPLRQPEVIGQDDLIVLTLLEEGAREAKETLGNFRRLILEALVRGLPRQPGLRKLKVTSMGVIQVTKE